MRDEIFNILLVEDNRGDVWLAREAFSKYKSINIIEKNDGEEAIQYLLNRKDVLIPDLILLDLNLPKKSGEEVLNLIKSTKELMMIPVITMSTDDTPSTVNRVYRMHTNCFVTKPGNVDEYFKVIDIIKQFWLKTVRLPFYEEQT